MPRVAEIQTTECIICHKESSQMIKGRCPRCYKRLYRYGDDITPKEQNLPITERLDSCPWCGSQPEVIQTHTSCKAIRCTNPECGVKPGTEIFRTNKSGGCDPMIDQWNKRA